MLLKQAAVLWGTVSRFFAIMSLLAFLVVLTPLLQVYSQPSPNLQKRIDAAIQAASNKTDLDYTEFVNPFIGTGPLIPNFASKPHSWVLSLDTVNYGDVW